MNMEFSLIMDRPIDKEIHYISPGGYCLRFIKPDHSSVDIEFDFCEYSGSVDGHVLRCSVSHLDVNAFPDSSELEHLLSSVASEQLEVAWVEFYVYTGEESDAVINPVLAKDVSVYTDRGEYSLPDYTFSGHDFDLPKDSLEPLKSALSRLQDVCKSLKFLRKGATCRLYDVHGVVYLCFSDSVLLPAVSVTKDFKVSVVSSVSTDGLRRVWPPVRKAIQDLNLYLKAPIQSVTIPYEDISKGIYRPSLEEAGSYDIILK